MFATVDYDGRIPEYKKSVYRGMSREEVLAKWKEAASKGSELHLLIEKYLNITGMDDYCLIDINKRRAILLHPDGLDKSAKLEHKICCEQFFRF